MRSLLFVPADGGSKLDKAMASGADAVILDLEDSIAPERKDEARASCARFPQARSAEERPPAPAGAHQRSRHRHDRRRSRRHGAGQARRHPVSQGRGRRDRDPSRRQAHRARSHRRPAGRRHQDPGADGGDGGRPVHRRQLSRFQRAADRHDLGAGGPVGRARRRGQPRSRRHAHRALSPRPRRSACSVRRRRRCRRSRPSTSISAMPRCCAATPNSRAATASPGGSRFIRRRCR